MKYNINIAQKLAYDNFGDQLDLIDLAIYDYARAAITAVKGMKKVIIKSKEYTWIDNKTLQKGMPLLRLKSKAPVYRRLLKLCDLGLLEKQIHKQYMPVFSLGPKADILVFEEKKAHTQKIEGSIPKDGGGQSKKTEGGQSQKTGNYNINNDNINIISDAEASPLNKIEGLYIQSMKVVIKEYDEKTDYKYGKNRKIWNTLIEKHGAAKVIRILGRYFKNGIGQKCNYTVNALQQDWTWNALLQNMPAKQYRTAADEKAEAIKKYS